MLYECPFCHDGMEYISGYELNGPEYGGGSKESDHYRCNDCQREYYHVVREYFSGNVENWDVKTGTGWANLAKEMWPKLIIKGKKLRSLTDAHLASQRLQEHKRRLEDVRLSFEEMLFTPDNDHRLTVLLEHLFSIFEVPFQRMFRLEPYNLDGFFTFEGRKFVVEAPWHKSPPDIDDLFGFIKKIENLSEYSQGFYVSGVKINPVTIQILQESRLPGIVLIDGTDLELILNGQVSLGVGLKVKMEKALKLCINYYSLENIAVSQLN
jgi:hypothetical protein